jgi:hypothetical protein
MTIILLNKTGGNSKGIVKLNSFLEKPTFNSPPDFSKILPKQASKSSSAYGTIYRIFSFLQYITRQKVNGKTKNRTEK